MILAAGMALDALLGEPKWLWDRLPHPAVVMGRVIAWTDRRFNKGENQQLKGTLIMSVIVGVTVFIGEIIARLPWPIEVLTIAILLAQRSLVDHVLDVADGLDDSLEEGRDAVAMIVGRDVTQLDQSGVARAAVESAAENLSDGVVAPLFWYFAFGLPGILVYKVVNTADSMIGYLTPRHRDFGWAAANMDDVANYFPARLTGIAIMLVQGAHRKFRPIRMGSRQHRSPNAGWPESAIAHSLDIALSGPRVYDGELEDDPFINPDGKKDIGPLEIRRASQVLWRVWVLCFLIAIIAGILVL